MANANGTATRTAEKIIGTYSTISGVHISIERGAAEDYASMIAAQLAALLQVRTLAKDCGHSTIGEENEINSHWLACNLADELEHLIPIVATDAQKGGAS